MPDTPEVDLGVFGGKQLEGQFPEIQKEQPVHRLMLWMRVRGAKIREIAEAIGRSPDGVSAVLRQPWARQRMVAMANASGRSYIDELLRGEAVDCIEKLVELRDDPEVPSHVQADCAKNLLDRYMGKPKQAIEHTTSNGMEHKSDEELREMLAQIEGEEHVAVSRLPALEP